MGALDVYCITSAWLQNVQCQFKMTYCFSIGWTQSSATRDCSRLPSRWIWKDIQSLENMNSQPGQGIEVPSVASPFPACLANPEGQGFKTHCQMEIRSTL